MFFLGYIIRLPLPPFFNTVVFLARSKSGSTGGSTVYCGEQVITFCVLIYTQLDKWLITRRVIFTRLLKLNFSFKKWFSRWAEKDAVKEKNSTYAYQNLIYLLYLPNWKMCTFLRGWNLEKMWRDKVSGRPTMSLQGACRVRLNFTSVQLDYTTDVTR